MPFFFRVHPSPGGVPVMHSLNYFVFSDHGTFLFNAPLRRILKDIPSNIGMFGRKAQNAFVFTCIPGYLGVNIRKSLSLHRPFYKRPAPS